jgi:hypothetical protein
MKRLLIFFLVCFQYANATTYYVKAAGGTGDGLSDATAWSFVKLNSTNLQNGDIVLFNRGDIFYGQLSLSSSGVTYDAYGSGANPIISGFKQLTSWTQSSGNIYYVPLTVPTLNMVTFDGAVVGMGRYPKTGYLVYTSNSNNTSITGSTAIPFNPTGGEVVIRKVRWILDRQKITSVSGNTINYTSGNTYGNSGIYSPSDDGNGYFVQSCMGALSQQGDWYYDAVNSRLYMYFSDAPTNHTVQASVQVQNVFINTLSNLNFNNLDFIGGNVYGASFNASSNDAFNNCNFRQQGGDAIYALSSTGIKVNASSITDALNNGINFLVNSNSSTVTSTTLTNIGTIAGAGASGDGTQQGITISGNGTTVSNCILQNIGYNGINFSGNNALIEKNLVNTFCTVKDDGGGIYTYNGSAGVVTTNRIVRNNIIINAIGAQAGTGWSYWEPWGKAAGIYLDDYSNGTQISNNGIANGGWNAIFLHNGYNNQITGNQTFNFGVTQFLVNEDIVGVVRNNTITGNNFIAKTAAEYTSEADMTVVDNIAATGTYNTNVYGRPMDDNQTIDIYKNYSGGSTVNLTLASWKSTYSQDLLSTTSPIIYPAYFVNSVTGSNLISNSTFDSAISGVSTTGSAVASWAVNNSLTAGSLKVVNTGTSYVVIPTGAVSSTIQYDLKFTALSSAPATINVYLRQNASPYTVLTPVTTLKLTTAAAQYECLFSNPTAQSNSSLVFESDNQSVTYSLDNIQLFQASSVTVINPDDFMIFVYNASNTASTVPLSTNYVDPQNVNYSGSVTLQPYTSLILMRKYCVQPPTPTIQTTTP